MFLAVKNGLFACTLGLLIIGSTSATFATTDMMSRTPPSVLAFDQKPQGNALRMSYAYLPADGYVVIYGTDKDGKPMKEPLGHVELKAGDHRDFSVPLTSTPPAGSVLWASLYASGDGKPGFGREQSRPFFASALPAENRILVK